MDFNFWGEIYSYPLLSPYFAIYRSYFYFIYFFFDKQLPPCHSVASFSACVFLASTPFLGHGLAEMENRPVA